jgi:hypothetical protein
MTDKERQREYFKQWYERNKVYMNKHRRKDSSSPTYRKRVLYSVWNNETDEVVIIDGNNIECAKAMGISQKSFYSLVTKNTKGKALKWTIQKTLLRKGEQV